MGKVGVSTWFLVFFESDNRLTGFCFSGVRMSTSKLNVDPEQIAHAEEDKFAL